MVMSVYHKVLWIIFLSLVIFGFLNWPFFEATIRGVTPQKELPMFLPPHTLNIPSLGIRAPLVFPKSNSEAEIQNSLADGIAWYAGTARVGEIGNMYLVGHSSDFPWAKGDYKNIFTHLPKMQIGEIIQVTDSQGKIFTYKVIETKAVAANDLRVLEQPKDRKLITLQTSYPIGTALKRFVVIGELAP